MAATSPAPAPSVRSHLALRGRAAAAACRRTGEAGVDAAGRRDRGRSGSAATSAADLAPGADDHAERVGARAGAEQLAGDRDAGRGQRRGDPLAGRARRRSRTRAWSGSRLPPTPCTNGSGNEPTTAGIESVARQSCRSHQIRSPRCTAVRGGALRGLDPVDVVEPVALRRRCPAWPSIDCDEAAAVAGLDLERALEHPHHGLRAGDLRSLTASRAAARRSPG